MQPGIGLKADLGGLTGDLIQHFHRRLLQGLHLLLHDRLKRLVIHEPWQLSAAILIFKFPDLSINIVITYRGKEKL